MKSPPNIYTLGWVNLSQKFEIQKYTVCGKLILPKKWKDIFQNFFGHNWHANLHGFANICKLPVSNTFRDNQSKIDGKYFYLNTLNFVIICISKNKFLMCY